MTLAISDPFGSRGDVEVGDYFGELGRKLAEYDLVIDAAYLHGLLTGYATIPAMNTGNLFQAVAGEQPLAESVVDAVFDSINSIAENLAAHETRICTSNSKWTCPGRMI